MNYLSTRMGNTILICSSARTGVAVAVSLQEFVLCDDDRYCKLVCLVVI